MLNVFKIRFENHKVLQFNSFQSLSTKQFYLQLFLMNEYEFK